MVKSPFYDSFKRQSPIIVPIMLSGLILIGLNLYTLINKEIENHKNIVHAEVFFSFFISLVVLIYMGMMLFFTLSSPKYFLKHFSKNIYYVLYALFLILTSPFVLTIAKEFTENKYHKYLSITTIFSTFFSIYYTLVVAFF
jgi:hypothetical protein